MSVAACLARDSSPIAMRERHVVGYETGWELKGLPRCRLTHAERGGVRRLAIVRGLDRGRAGEEAPRLATSGNYRQRRPAIPFEDKKALEDIGLEPAGPLPASPSPCDLLGPGD